MASNKRLNATITIGGVITGALKSALGTTRQKLQEIGGAVHKLEREQKLLSSGIQTFGAMGKNVDGLRTRYAAVTEEIGKTRREYERLNKVVERQDAIANARSQYRTAMFDKAGAALAIGGLMRAPLKSFEDLDAAMNNMQVAMTNSTGKLPIQFEAIKKQTIELGNVLPGTTADFVNLATALKEQGMPMEAISGGALKSAAHLSVVMKMVPEQAGEMVAKLREAFQLGEHEFERMADYTQRARFGFGLKSEDLLLGAKYYGGKLNALGMNGADNVRRIYAIQGMAAQQGMDGSTFGTNFSMMLTRVGLMTERLHKNSKEMKAVNATLADAGIHMTFFNKAGKFAGVDNMVQQLGKLKDLSMEKRLQVLTRLFGEEGGRVADLIARNGVDGYNKALQAMDAEASLAQRIAIATSSFKNQIEAFTGTFTNFLAAVGKPVAEMFTPVLRTLNEIVGGPLMSFIEKNETAVKVVGSLLAASAGVLALGAGINALGFVSTFATGGLMSMATWGLRLGEAALWLGTTVLPLIGSALPALQGAFVGLGAAMMATPVGWIVAIGAAVVAIGVAVYKYWEPIKAFFAGFGSGIIAALTPVEQAFKDAFAPILNVIGPLVMPILNTVGGWIRSAAGWFGSLLTPIDAASKTTLAFGEAGKVAGKVVGDVFRSMLPPIEAVLNAIKWIQNNIGGAIEKAAQMGRSVQQAGSSTFNKVAGWFGGGTASVPPAAPTAPVPPAAPRMATAPGNARTGDVKQTNTFNITQQPGQNSKQLADEVARRLKQQQEAQRRGVMYDAAWGY